MVGPISEAGSADSNSCILSLYTAVKIKCNDVDLITVIGLWNDYHNYLFIRQSSAITVWLCENNIPIWGNYRSKTIIRRAIYATIRNRCFVRSPWKMIGGIMVSYALTSLVDYYFFIRYLIILTFGEVL